MRYQPAEQNPISVNVSPLHKLPPTIGASSIEEGDSTIFVAMYVNPEFLLGAFT